MMVALTLPLKNMWLALLLSDYLGMRATQAAKKNAKCITDCCFDIYFSVT